MGRKRRSDNIINDLPTKVKLPRGEILEEFLKDRDIWKEYRKSRTNRRFQGQLGMIMYIKKMGLSNEWKEYYEMRGVEEELKDLSGSD